MFETISMNLLADSVWIFVFSGLIMLIAMRGFLWLHDKVRSKLRSRGLRLICDMIFIPLLLSVPILGSFYAVYGPYGDCDAITVYEQGGERLISARFSNAKRTKNSVVVFSNEGDETASQGRRPPYMFNGRIETLWSEGRIELTRHGEELELVDVISRQQVVDVSAHLSKRFGQEQYRVKKVQAEQLVIEQRDGKLAYLSLREIAPKALLEPLPTQDLWDDCKALASTSEDKKALYGLQRARKVQSGGKAPCVYALSPSAKLVLHRASAFGEDLDYRLSAVSAEGAKVMWTTDLGPVLGQELEQVAIYAPWVDGEQLCFWLVRDKRSLSQVCAEAKTGKLRSSKVIF